MDNWPREGYKEVAETLLKNDEVISRDILIDIAINMIVDTIEFANSYY